jgi:hypothetical protein
MMFSSRLKRKRKEGKTLFEQLTGSINHVNQNSISSSRDLDQGRPEYKSAIVTTTNHHLVAGLAS